MATVVGRKDVIIKPIEQKIEKKEVENKKTSKPTKNK